MSQRRVPVAVGAAVLALVAVAAVSWSSVEPPSYQPVNGLRGTLNAAGSDTMLQLQSLMAEAFQRIYPQVTVQIEGKGSSTAPPALMENAIQIGNMSRRISPPESEAFAERHGFEPLRVDVALDTVGVFVHRDNPIRHLSMAQLDAIFSGTRRCGGPVDLRLWGQLALPGRWATAPISLYGRNAASGTYSFFKEHALCGGDFKPTVKEQPGSASVVQGVELDPNGIGYSGIGYATSGVRAVPLVPSAGGEPVEPNHANAVTGRYPLSRFLEVYVLVEPGGPLDRVTAEYLRFMLSAEGQEVVRRAGYHPLDPATLALQRAKLGG